MGLQRRSSGQWWIYKHSMGFKEDSAFQGCSVQSQGFVTDVPGVLQEVSRSFRAVPGGLWGLNGRSKGVQGVHWHFRCWHSMFEEVSRGLESIPDLFKRFLGRSMAVLGASEGFRGIPEALQGFSEVSWAFHGISRGLTRVPRAFTGFREHFCRFNVVAKVFRRSQGRSRDLLGVFQGCCMQLYEVTEAFQGPQGVYRHSMRFKGGPAFQRCPVQAQGVSFGSKSAPGVLQVVSRSFRGVPGVFWAFQEVSEASQGVSRDIMGVPKEFIDNPEVFQEVSEVKECYRVFQEISGEIHNYSRASESFNSRAFHGVSSAP